MISLKSKKDKKKMMKGGSITNPEEKKLIFDALFQLCDSIIEDTDFQQFNETIQIKENYYQNNSSYNLKYNYLYFTFKYLFGLLFDNGINKQLPNKELLEKMYDYIIIIKGVPEQLDRQIEIPIDRVEFIIDQMTGQPRPITIRENKIINQQEYNLYLSKIYFDKNQNIEFKIQKENDMKR